MMQSQSTLDGYRYTVQQTTEGDYSKCTVVIKKNTIDADIIEKQTILITKMKQDSILMKRMLENKNNEIIKWKKMFEEISVDKENIIFEIDQVRKKIENDYDFEVMNRELVMENGRLIEQVQIVKA